MVHMDTLWTSLPGHLAEAILHMLPNKTLRILSKACLEAANAQVRVIRGNLCMLDRFKNLEELRWRCGDAAMTLPEHTRLTRLYCDCTEVDELRPCAGLTTVSCNFTCITRLPLESCAANLTVLRCSVTCITSLDVTMCAHLKELRCSTTDIEQLDVTHCTRLVKLDCSNTRIARLDVSNCVQLAWLDCHMTRLVELDVTKCARLMNLKCNMCIRLISCTHIATLIGAGHE